MSLEGRVPLHRKNRRGLLVGGASAFLAALYNPVIEIPSVKLFLNSLAHFYDAPELRNFGNMRRALNRLSSQDDAHLLEVTCQFLNGNSMETYIGMTNSWSGRLSHDEFERSMYASGNILAKSVSANANQIVWKVLFKNRQVYEQLFVPHAESIFSGNFHLPGWEIKTEFSKIAIEADGNLTAQRIDQKKFIV